MQRLPGCRRAYCRDRLLYENGDGGLSGINGRIEHAAAAWMSAVACLFGVATVAVAACSPPPYQKQHGSLSYSGRRSHPRPPAPFLSANILSLSVSSGEGDADKPLLERLNHRMSESTSKNVFGAAFPHPKLLLEDNILRGLELASGEDAGLQGTATTAAANSRT